MTVVQKRDGRVEKWDKQKIDRAIKACLVNNLSAREFDAANVAHQVADSVERIVKNLSEPSGVHVEEIQRLVIQQLWAHNHCEAAEQYTLYREKRRVERATFPIGAEEQKLIEEDAAHFPSPLQYYQYLSKFSRWQDHLNRRETWRETCERVINWLWSVPKVTDVLTGEEMKRLHASLYNMEATCAMRVIQMAGPALDRCNVGVYNCLTSDTKFVTKEGVRSFEDFNDGDEVTVLSHTGEWRDAVVRSYGKQKVNNITFKRGKSNIKVRATANHRWLLHNGQVTTSLKVGDRLRPPPSLASEWDYDKSEPDEKLFWAYGFVYGDGTLVKRNGEYKHSMVRLCGSKSELLDRFKELGFSYSFPPSCSGEPIVYTGTYLKKLPDITADGVAKTAAFVRGWLDADGGKSANPTPANPFASIQASGEESVRFIREVFPAVGVYITSERDLSGQPTNYGVRKTPTVIFGVVQWFGGSHNGSTYSTTDIVPDSDDAVPVWCLEVEEDKSFVLPNGVVTGNCSYAPIVDLFSFSEMLYVLMQGTGMGFSVESDYVDQLPKVKKQKIGPPTKHLIEDSTEGWCDALKIGLETWFSGRDVEFNYSLIRPAGARLKTKGGQASGPKPLQDLLNFARKLILSRQGTYLDDIDVHDLCCMIGKIVQVGGVRRASLISLSDLDSTKMRNAKSGNWYEHSVHRTMANNSAVYDGRPSDEEFMEEWLSLCKAKSGERGIFNRKAVSKNAPSRRAKSKFGTNPCVTGDTLLLTKTGWFRIDSLVGQSVEVWNGKEWSEVSPCITGQDVPVVRVKTDDGLWLDCTKYHAFYLADGEKVNAKDLKPGDVLEKIQPGSVTEPVGYTSVDENEAYLAGFFCGDGWVDGQNGARKITFYGREKIEIGESLAEWGLVSLAKYEEKHDRQVGTVNVELPPKTEVPYNQSLSYRVNWIAGLLDSDGCVVYSDKSKMSYSYQITSVNKKFLQKTLLLLRGLGVGSKLGKLHDAGVKSLPGGDYHCQTSWRLTISTGSAVALVRLGLSCRRLATTDNNPQRDASRFVRVKSVTDLGVADKVYCFKEPKRGRAVFNGILTGQCAEIVLRAFEFCNLSIVVARPWDTRETLRQKVIDATFFGVIQSLCTDFKYLRPEWKKNCEEERLLGVDITGHADCPLLRKGAPGRAALLKEFRKLVNETRHSLAERFGINDSAADTCVKPGGNSGVFFDCANGVSPRFSEYQIRWVRQPSNSPMAKFLIDEGVPHAVAPEDPSLLVFGFPKKSPEGSTTRNEMSAVEQLENWLEWKQHWAEHSVSATIYIRDDEWVEAGAWVLKNFNEISGLSFLPKDNTFYSYAPNEEITKERYEQMMAEFPKINWAKLRRYESAGEAAQPNLEYACVGGSCEM